MKEEFAEWFPLTMTGLNNIKIMPSSLSAEQLQSIDVPVMFIFGTRENLVGDLEAAKALVQEFPLCGWKL